MVPQKELLTVIKGATVFAESRATEKLFNIVTCLLIIIIQGGPIRENKQLLF